ncbi:SDR family NAD(P)-dependent oxidoreductase [Nocardia sp. CA-135953]|uniref:SDR family NAD(P)-dependent oxidoreductase n=1 Tax=Nocardia sp. CA-135953 TaxID=3239978 RepID=UPI003D961BEA
MSTADTASVRPNPPVSIVGIGCRVPGAPNVSEFWRMLCDGRDATGAPPPGRPGTRYAGYLTDVDAFDNDWFAISGREAALMDPQQRLALEVAIEALDDAGIGYHTRGSGAAVVFGACAYDHGIAVLGRDGHDAPYAVTGSALSIIANRLSYVLDLHGPSLVVDSACSSSLAAVDLAVRLLADEAVPFAIVGGVNLTLLPHTSEYLAEGGFLAPDGRCKPFDAAADGYARGDGCTVVVLRRTADALRDGHRVYAEILGTAVGSDGRSNGLYAPSGRAQQDIIRTAWARAGLDPHDVGYVECHGTGTPLGDAVEVGALAAVVGGGAEPTWIGSLKSNIGHLEAAAGITGMVKAALSIRHGAIPPTIYFHTENPLLKLAEHGLRVPTEPVDWTETPVCARRAGVSSFGFGGTNAHVVLRGLDAARHRSYEPPVLLPVTGRDIAELRSHALRWAKLLECMSSDGTSNDSRNSMSNAPRDRPSSATRDRMSTAPGNDTTSASHDNIRAPYHNGASSSVHGDTGNARRESTCRTSQERTSDSHEGASDDSPERTSGDSPEHISGTSRAGTRGDSGERTSTATRADIGAATGAIVASYSGIGGSDHEILRQFAAGAARLIPENARAAVVARDLDDAVDQLRALAGGESGGGVIGPGSVRRRGGVLFLFSGQGGQYSKMGRGLAARYPVFAQAVTAAADAIAAAGGGRVWTPRNGFALSGAASNGSSATEFVQPAIFAFQVALAELLAAWGIEPDAVVGHSLGEVAGAAVSGALSLPDAARVVVQRSRILARLDGHGAMAVLETTADEAARLVEPLHTTVAIAAINGPRSVVISGAPRYIDALVRRAKRRQIFAQRIAVDFAAHSPQVGALFPEFVDTLGGLTAQVPRVPVYSTARRRETITTAAMDGDYWAENASRTVDLAAALQKAADDGFATVLEIAPHPVLTPAIGEFPEFAGATHTVTTRDNEAGTFLTCLAKLYLEGRPLNWAANGPFTAPPPARQWSHRRFPPITIIDPGTTNVPATQADTTNVPATKPRTSYVAATEPDTTSDATTEPRTTSNTATEPRTTRDIATRADTTNVPAIEPSTSYVVVSEPRTSHDAAAKPDAATESGVIRDAATKPSSTRAAATELDTHGTPTTPPTTGHVGTKPENIYGTATENSTPRDAATEPHTHGAAAEPGTTRRSATDPTLNGHAVNNSPVSDFGTGIGVDVVRSEPHDSNATNQLAAPHSRNAQGANTTTEQDAAGGQDALDPKATARDWNTTARPDTASGRDTDSANRTTGRETIRSRNAQGADIPSGFDIGGGPDAHDWNTTTPLDRDIHATNTTSGFDIGRSRKAVDSSASGVFIAESEFPADDLHDHVVQGAPTVPAVFWLLRLIGLAGAGRTIGDFVVHERTGLAALSVVTYRADGAGKLRAEVTGAGTLASARLAGDPTPGDIVAWMRVVDANRAVRRRMRALTPGVFYDSLRARQLDYGPGFRALRDIEAGPDCAVGSFDSAPLQRSSTLDSCLQVLAAATWDHLPADAIPLPFGIESAWLSAEPDLVLLEAHALVRDRSTTGVTGDIIGTDQHGVPVLALSGVRIRFAAIESTMQVGPFRQETWIPYLGNAESNGRRTSTTNPRRALVIGESQLAIRLARELDRTLPTERVAREPDAAGPIVSAVLAGRADTADTAVVVVWPTESGATHTGHDIESAISAAATTGRMLDLLQRVQSEDTTASLTIVLPEPGATDRQPPARSRQRSSPDKTIMTMAVAGLVRSMQLESGREVRLVWTDRSPSAVSRLQELIATAHALPDELRVCADAIMARRFVPTRPRSTTPTPIDPNGTYVVTGGLGALGSVAVRWLLDAGAHDVVVLTRAPRPVPALLDGLEDRIVVVRCDAADRSDLANALDDVRECGSTIRGVVHAAGALEDAAFEAVTARQLARMFAPKPIAAKNLIELTATDPTDFVLLFSSATGALGAPGQGAYASANAAMDALAHKHPGRRVSSIGWGVWDSGLTQSAGGAAHLRRAGIRAFDIARGTELLAQTMYYNEPYLLALDYAPTADPDPVATRLRNLLTDQPATVPAPPNPIPPRPAEPLTTTIRTALAATLDLTADHVDPEADFNELGMSSLLGIEMRRRLETRLNIRISTAELFRHPTVTALGAALADRVAAAKSDGAL